MTCSHRMHDLKWPMIFCLLSAGCGPVKLKEMQSADGQISIEIVDPVECDQSRNAKAFLVGKGLDSWLNTSAVLDNRVCDSEFDPSDYVLLEDSGWLAIASKSAIQTDELKLDGCIFIFIERNQKKDYRPFPPGGEWPPESPLWQDLLGEVSRRRIASGDETL
jgi:hypothetical protein